MRACVRANSGLTEARILLSGLNLVNLGIEILERASSIPPPSLRSLDAIHLATAVSVESELTAFVTYDRRLQQAAREAGLPVMAPA